jgi:hypothetical protein
MVKTIFKDLGIALVAFCAGIFNTGCTTSGLSQYAESVPDALDCGALDGTRGEPLVKLAVTSPVEFAKDVQVRAKASPKDLACSLLDARISLLTSGQRASEAYGKVRDALDALGLE